MSTPRPTITIDTNCAINIFDGGSTTATSVAELQTLFRYALSGRIELSATTRIEVDLLQDKDPARQAELLKVLDMLPIVGTLARWDVSRWGTADFWSKDETGQLAAEIQKILAPGLSPSDKRFSNKANDIVHLASHAHNRRDIFVTDDTGILRRAEDLARATGIVVKTPAACVAYVDDIVLRAAPRLLPSDGINPGYHARALQGIVTFDYSNNNHRYAIGDGHHLFETAWSKGSDVRIHALKDPPSIDVIALASGAASIEAITDATAYDFTSRSRTPAIGQTVLWRNQNGLYAATQIVAIRDDTRYDGPDELAFRYIILADGGTDFSAA